MKKTLFPLVAMLVGAASVMAQSVSPWLQDVKLSGYGMVQYQASDKEGGEQNGFALRLVRVSLDGRAHDDFSYKLQMQVNGNTYDPDTRTDIRLVDLWGEWQRYKFLRVKAGQFKRPFTFENPMHPVTQGFMSYAQNITKLVGYSDRTGEQGSNGRDLGLQLQGDLIECGGHAWLHYQVGVFNGEGINQKDRDNRKDIIGGLWVMPAEGLRIGAFGWTGSRAGVGSKNRYALSAEYARRDWTLRSEYVHSEGRGATATAGDKADGLYALCIAPVIARRMHVKARYDLYRDRKDWATSKTFYEVGADYMFTKNLQLNVEYARVNERASHSTYNLIDCQLDIKF